LILLAKRKRLSSVFLQALFLTRTKIQKDSLKKDSLIRISIFKNPWPIVQLKYRPVSL